MAIIKADKRIKEPKKRNAMERKQTESENQLLSDKKEWGRDTSDVSLHNWKHHWTINRIVCASMCVCLCVFFSLCVGEREKQMLEISPITLNTLVINCTTEVHSQLLTDV